MASIAGGGVFAGRGDCRSIFAIGIADPPTSSKGPRDDFCAFSLANTIN